MEDSLNTLLLKGQPFIEEALKKTESEFSNLQNLSENDQKALINHHSLLVYALYLLKDGISSGNFEKINKSSEIKP